MAKGWVSLKKFVYCLWALDKLFPLFGLLVDVCERMTNSYFCGFVGFSPFSLLNNKGNLA